MMADIFTPQKMKRWLMEGFRPIHWDDIAEVGSVFRPLGLILTRMEFNVMEGSLELRFSVNYWTDDSLAQLEIIAHRYGANLLDYRLSVERPVRHLPCGPLGTLRYEGRETAELTAWVLPHLSQKTLAFRHKWLKQLKSRGG